MTDADDQAEPTPVDLEGGWFGPLTVSVGERSTIRTPRLMGPVLTEVDWRGRRLPPPTL